jgi:hypothetical protein
VESLFDVDARFALRRVDGPLAVGVAGGMMLKWHSKPKIVSMGCWTVQDAEMSKSEQLVIAGMGGWSAFRGCEVGSLMSLLSTPSVFKPPHLPDYEGFQLAAVIEY